MEATLEAVRRDGRGKGAARRTRRDGRVPAVYYGADKREDGRPLAIPITVDPKELLGILHSESGANTLISLKLDGGDSRVMIREYQLDPVTHRLLHADFYKVAMDKKVAVMVPIVVKGEPRGVKQQGGLLDFVHREVEIECLPADIPESIEVDVSELLVGQSVRLREVSTDVRWQPLTDPEVMLVHVVAPKLQAEAPAAEAATPAAPAEPEVIKKGKADKGEEEGE
ncbi:MAG: 50S ribosomal protein L25 [Acidobacteria bacterium]|nr:MAG: 50S ribosomal protein L25 [Acidobacteriota bacterium]RPJ78559.1 MAG: 50S ribosomal protein L25 [Acidobacteriota bacterium]